MKKTKTAPESSGYISDFKAMPFFLKILLLVSLCSLVVNFLDLVQMKPVSFNYFNSSFPSSFPLLWYIYLVAMDAFGIVVFFKRSYSLLQKYLYVCLAMLSVTLLNIMSDIFALPADERLFMTVFYAILFTLVGLIFLYLWKQKKYFNKP